METASHQLQSKFEAARSFLEHAPRAGADPVATAGLAGELRALEGQFALAAAPLYLATAAAGETGRLWAGAEFTRLLAARDFAGAVDRLVVRGEAALRAAGVSPAAPAAARAAARRLLDVYPRGGPGEGGAGVGPAAGAPQRVDFEHCPACGGDMAVDAGRSELHCYDAECGAVRKLVGTVFDDAQFYSQEGQKAKSGTFNPNRHFQFWWTHLLAREPEEGLGDKDDPDNAYGEKMLAAMRAIVVRDRKVLRLLTVNDVRAMLRELGRTSLNKNVPLILKKLTGIGPPSVPDAIVVRVENLFTKAIEIDERIRRDDRANRNYYPFYIFKILDQLLPANDLENRRVLYYIYVQGKETVEADDANWEQICALLPDITYKPTDRFLGLKYHPV